MFIKPPFSYFEITLIQIHFAKTTLGFSVITKIPFFTCTLNFQKLYINIHKLYTNKHKFHANNYLPNLQVLDCHSVRLKNCTPYGVAPEP
jgi:hypothetical protein